MSMRIRMGPVSVSSRGRVGAHAGPFSAYGGGSRRGRGVGGGEALGALLLLGLVIIVVQFLIKWWFIVAPVAVLLAVLIFFGVKSRNERQRQAEADRLAEAERLRVLRAEEQRRAHEAWLAGPPPPLSMPGRFTQNWIQANVPRLHPGQVPALIRELRSRGWSDDRIDERVAPYL